MRARIGPDHTTFGFSQHMLGCFGPDGSHSPLFHHLFPTTNNRVSIEITGDCNLETNMVTISVPIPAKIVADDESKIIVGDVQYLLVPHQQVASAIHIVHVP